MNRVGRHVFGATAALIGSLTAFSGLSTPAFAGASAAEAGQKVAFTRSKGNCLACHMIPGGESPGTIAPPLVGMQARFPDKAKLRAQIWDATVANPESSMPPFGRHGILSEEEIDQLVEFISAQ